VNGESAAEGFERRVDPLDVLDNVGSHVERPQVCDGESSHAPTVGGIARRFDYL
jgi:hypothetical protein